MTDKKKAPLTQGSNPIVCGVSGKGSKISSNCYADYRVTDSTRRAYAETEQLRNTELWQGRKFFYDHPNGEYSRADLCDHLDLPINHITRVAYNLLDEGYICVVGKGLNPRSGRQVELLRYEKAQTDE